jgi:hypothetical protein
VFRSANPASNTRPFYASNWSEQLVESLYSGSKMADRFRASSINPCSRSSIWPRKGAISIILRNQKHAFCSLTDDLGREDLHWSVASHGLRIHTGREGTERHKAFLQEMSILEEV